MTSTRTEERNLRLLVLVAYPAIDGPLPKLGPLLVDALREAGAEVDVAYWSRHREHERLYEKVVGRAGDVFRARRLAQLTGYDCLLVTTTHDWSGIVRDTVLLAIMRHSCRLRILHFHGSWSDCLVAPGNLLLKLGTRVLLSLSSAVFVLSREELSEWRAFTHKTPVFVVRNPHLARGRHRDGSHEPRPGGPFRFLYVGRLYKGKGLEELVTAFARVSERLEVRLDIAGRGPLEVPVRTLVSELGLDHSVTLKGYLDGVELDDLYERSDALVLPSYREGFPTVYLEAMDHGLPIVTTSIRGAVDSLRPDVNALLVSPGSIDELAVAMTRLASDPGLCSTMGANNVQKLEEFRPNRVVEDYVAAIRSLM